MRLVPVSTLITKLTVTRPGWFDHFAVGTQFFARQLLDQVGELELVLPFVVFLRSIVSLNVARAGTHPEIPGCKKLDANQ